jgi:hypothetical protein
LYANGMAEFTWSNPSEKTRLGSTMTATEVLGLYRKREGARRLHELGVFARFRYNDLKEAARGCGGRRPYENSMV